MNDDEANNHQEDPACAGEHPDSRTDGTQAKAYFEKFLELARKEENPNAQLTEMIQKAEMLLRTTNFAGGKRR